jgi:hypothetical protein
VKTVYLSYRHMTTRYYISNRLFVKEF